MEVTDKPAARQYVAASFTPGSPKLYTYHNDGERCAVGDEIMLPSRLNDGWTRGFVVQVDMPKPAFETKAILGKAPPRDGGAA